MAAKKKHPRSKSNYPFHGPRAHLKTNSSNPDSSDLFINLDLSNANNTAQLLEILKQIEVSRAGQGVRKGPRRVGKD